MMYHQLPSYQKKKCLEGMLSSKGNQLPVEKAKLAVMSGEGKKNSIMKNSKDNADTKIWAYLRFIPMDHGFFCFRFS